MQVRKFLFVKRLFGVFAFAKDCVFLVHNNDVDFFLTFFDGVVAPPASNFFCEKW